jgi:predicted metal-dependent hydrolase
MKSLKSEIRVLEINDKKINLVINYKRMRTMRLGIRQDGQATLSVPYNIDKSHIDGFIKDNSKWILNKHEKRNKQLQESQLDYLPDELHWFLGKQFPLKIYRSNRNIAFIKDDYIHLVAADPSKWEKRKKIMEEFYKSEAYIVFGEILQSLKGEMDSRNIPFPNLKVKKMRRSWGICYPSKKQIVINWFLLKASKFCIRYIIIHELCHFLEQNHSKSFYKVMNEWMPNWRDAHFELTKMNLIDNIYADS